MSPDLQAALFRRNAITETVPVGIFMTDPQGRSLYANPAYQRITGVSLEETLGDGWTQAIHPDDQEKVMESWSLAERVRVAVSKIVNVLRPLTSASGSRPGLRMRVTDYL